MSRVVAYHARSRSHAARHQPPSFNQGGAAVSTLPRARVQHPRAEGARSTVVCPTEEAPAPVHYRHRWQEELWLMGYSINGGEIILKIR